MRHFYIWNLIEPPFTERSYSAIIPLLEMLTQRKKKNVVKEYQLHETDTGSPNIQIAIATKRIDELASHLKKHPKDRHSRRGLLGMVNRRRKLLRYLQNKSPEGYKKLIKKLGLKK